MTEPKIEYMTAKGSLIKFSVKANATAFWPLPDAHPCYALVGLIAAEGARIEHLLDQTIAYAAGVDHKIGACFTGQMIGPAPRFAALLQLCKERGLAGQFGKRINTISGRSASAFDKRNRAVHDPWLQEVGEGTSHQFIGKPKRVSDFGVKPKSDEDLKVDLAALRKNREEVLNLVSDIWTALRPA